MPHFWKSQVRKYIENINNSKMSFFRNKEKVVVQRKQGFSSFIQTWFGSRERCASSDSLKSDVNAVDAEGLTKLHLASLKGCSTTVQKLLQGAADVNSKVTTHITDAGYTPLHYAVREGNSEIVKTLLKNNARVDCESNCGLTALHIAAKSGNVPIAEALLNNGASIYSECTLQETACCIPLHFALKYRHYGMVKLLLASGARKANSDYQNKYSKTTFRLAHNTEDYTIIAYVLMSHISFNTNSNKMFLLDAVSGAEMEYAAVAEHISSWIFTALDRSNCDLLLPTLLHSAVEMGYLKIVKDFMKWGMSINRVQHPVHARVTGDTYGFSLLHTATNNGHLDIVKLLLSDRVNVNFKDNNQRTPIFYAIVNLDVRMTKLLLSHGANVDTEEN